MSRESGTMRDSLTFPPDPRMSQLLPPHDDLDLSLEDLGAALGAAEVHGLLTGVACAGTTLAAGDLRGFLEGELDTALDEDAFREWRQVDATVHRQLDDDDLGFELLLPDDDRPLTERVAAMANWCSGFLAGFGSASGDIDEARLPADVRDLLGSISEISRADADAHEEDEDAEREYAEVLEYLRIAALTIYLELAEPRDGGPAPGAALH